MRTPEPRSIIILLVAEAAAVGGVLLALLAGSAWLRGLGAVIGVGIPVALVVSVRGRFGRPAGFAVLAIPLTVLLVGVPVVLIGDGTGATGTGGTGSGGAVDRADDGIPASPNAALREAFDRADQLVPGGADSVITIRMDDDSSWLHVFDAKTGEEVMSWHGSSGWSEPRRTRANNRSTFSRADATDMDLDAALPEVRRVAQELGIDLDDPHPADDLEVTRRREDGALLATFDVSQREIQVGADGQVANTVAFGFLDTVLDATAELLADLRLDPAAPTLRSMDFRAFEKDSRTVQATSIGMYGGVELDFASGPYTTIVAIPGRFPELRPRTSRESAGLFALSDLRTGMLLTVRDDIAGRFRLPDYDLALVGFRVHQTPGDRIAGIFDPPARIVMAVGPSSARADAIYTLGGEYLRDGTW